MNVIKIESKERLNNFISSQKHSQFLQSWQWGEFHTKVSDGVVRMGVEKNGEIIMAITLIRKTLPMGKKYFYAPRGPIGLYGAYDNEALNALFTEIESMARSENDMFLRFDPSNEILLDLPVVKTLNIEPKHTQMLKLHKSEDVLLEAMHQKTRYNIRLAEKKGVTVREGKAEDFEIFWNLLSLTTDRDNFRPHGRDYYESMLKTDPSFIKLYIAELEGKPLVANIISFFGDTVTYIHGASSNDDRNVMAPYLMQWHVIKEAKKQGYLYYDFYGIDTKRWPGVTRFKQGFGGFEKHYPGTYDLIFDPGWYSIYKMIRKARRTF